MERGVLHIHLFLNQLVSLLVFLTKQMLQVMNFLRSCLSGNVLILPYFLKIVSLK